jgi:hypothetical protein
MPPLELFRIMLSVGSIVDGTAEGIKNTTVNMGTAELFEFAIEVFRIFALQTAWSFHPEIVEIAGQARSDAGDRLERIRRGFLHNSIVHCLGEPWVTAPPVHQRGGILEAINV